MKELDFDELDKAVNSLMSNVPKDAPQKEVDTTVTIPPSTDTQPVGPTPSVPTPVATPVESPRSAAATGSLASRRGGRFMDMVHPSAEMKKPERAAKPVSRQGVTVAPTSSASSTESALPAQENEPVVAEMPAHTDPLPSPHQPTATSDWPDPLELAAKKDEKLELSPVQPDEKAEELAESTPLTSPFLPNTKVEKRPLGSPAANDSSEPSIIGTGKEDLTVDNPDDQLPPAPSEPEQPLPEELQGDLVAIESGAAKESTGEAPKPHLSIDEKPAEEKKPEEKPPAPSGPVSIPKQYKEEPSSGDQENGAIYDTDTYHQPLAHPAKKKPGWIVVLWIVLILAVGASAGAALFFFQII